MTKRKSLLILMLILMAALSLALTACSRVQDEPVEAAINFANERIKEYHQNDSAFADTLMHYLPNSCVYDDEDGFLIYYDGKTYVYTQKLEDSGKNCVFYPTLSDAIGAENAVGQTIYTLGYHTSYDGGCARYVVGESATSDISVKCGDLYLNYASSKNKVSLKQMGFEGGDLAEYQKKFEKYSKINTLIFPKGEYGLLDAVRTDRDDVNYFGIEATLYSAENFGGSVNKVYDSLWSVRKTWSSTKTIKNQTYSGINFEMRARTFSSEEGIKGLSYLMQIAYCKNINVFRCNYLVPSGLYDGDFKTYSTHCVDLFTAWHDVKFDGCAFENYSYSNLGGAIGFRDIYNEGCDNLVFENNLVVSSVRDEGVALFAGLDKRNRPDAELGKGYIRNCRLENNTFKALEAKEGLEPRVMFLTVGYQLSPVYDIKYLNNTFEGYCNSYFLHYCYCEGLTFKGNKVNIKQSGNAKKMTLVYHNDSPNASDIVVEDNEFNLLGDNFQLNSTTMISPYSDGEEITFKNNVINLPEGYAETVIASDATVKDNVFNLSRAGSIYYRTTGNISGNTYNISKLEKSIYEFYNANVKHDLVVKNEKIVVDVSTCNMLMFNGTNLKFNGHSLLFEDVKFDVKKVDKTYYHISWSSDAITDTVVPITFRRCTFGAYDGHLTIANGSKHILKIE